MFILAEDLDVWQSVCLAGPVPKHYRLHWLCKGGEDREEKAPIREHWEKNLQSSQCSFATQIQLGEVA